MSTQLCIVLLTIASYGLINCAVIPENGVALPANGASDLDTLLLNLLGDLEQYFDNKMEKSQSEEKRGNHGLGKRTNEEINPSNILDYMSAAGYWQSQSDNKRAGNNGLGR